MRNPLLTGFSTLANLSTVCDVVMINSVKLTWRNMITELFSGENHRCSCIIFSIQMAMAIIMLIYVNLSSDTITWSDLTFNLIYVIHSECHKKTITFDCQHTRWYYRNKLFNYDTGWNTLQKNFSIANVSKRQEMVGLFFARSESSKRFEKVSLFSQSCLTLKCSLRNVCFEGITVTVLYKWTTLCAVSFE